MTFVTECPSCAIRIKGIPEHQVDQAIECPRCHDSFTPAFLETEKPARGVGSAKARAAERSSREAREIAPSFTLVPANRWALAALVLGSFAFLSATTGKLHVISFGLSFFGLFCAVFGLQRRVTHGGALALPLAGFTVSLPALIITLFWPNLLDVRSGGSGDSVSAPFPENKTIAVRNLGLGQEDKNEDPAWADAGGEVLRQGDARIRVTSARIMALDVHDVDSGDTIRRDSLVIGVRLRNMGASKMLRFTRWATADARSGQVLPHLKDDRGHHYRLLRAAPSKEIVEPALGTTLPPGKDVTDVLVFEEPANDVQALYLELPAEVFGGAGSLRWEIPARMISRQGIGGGAAPH